MLASTRWSLGLSLPSSIASHNTTVMEAAEVLPYRSTLTKTLSRDNPADWPWPR